MANAIPSLIQALRAEGLPCAEGEPLARHCTFRIGGPAAVFCTPHTAPALLRALELCSEYGVRTYLLGNGSNVLFADEGFAGAVICLTGLETNFSCTEQGIPPPSRSAPAARWPRCAMRSAPAG